MIGTRLANLIHRCVGGGYGAFNRQQILLRFDQQHICAAGDQPAHLWEKTLPQFVKGGETE